MRSAIRSAVSPWWGWVGTPSGSFVDLLCLSVAVTLCFSSQVLPLPVFAYLYMPWMEITY